MRSRSAGTVPASEEALLREVMLRALGVGAAIPTYVDPARYCRETARSRVGKITTRVARGAFLSKM